MGCSALLPCDRASYQGRSSKERDCLSGMPSVRRRHAGRRQGGYLTVNPIFPPALPATQSPTVVKRVPPNETRDAVTDGTIRGSELSL